MSEINITIAKSFADIIMCHHIRAVTFLQTEPYFEEFDNKDFEMATHIIAKSENIPVACMRLSLVPNNTIHWGRLAILPSISGKDRMKTLFSMTAFVEEYSQKKRFNKIIGEVADKRLMKFWMKKGFSLTGDKPLIFGEKEYWPFEKYINYVQFEKDDFEHIPKVKDDYIRTGRLV